MEWLSARLAQDQQTLKGRQATSAAETINRSTMLRAALRYVDTYVEALMLALTINNSSLTTNYPSHFPKL